MAIKNKLMKNITLKRMPGVFVKDLFDADLAGKDESVLFERRMISVAWLDYWQMNFAEDEGYYLFTRDAIKISGMAEV